MHGDLSLSSPCLIISHSISLSLSHYSLLPLQVSISPKYYSADPLVCSSLWWWRFYAKRSPKPFAILRWLIFSHSHPLFYFFHDSSWSAIQGFRVLTIVYPILFWTHSLYTWIGHIGCLGGWRNWPFYQKIRLFW